jgi:hypothetical protein
MVNWAFSHLGRTSHLTHMSRKADPCHVQKVGSLKDHSKVGSKGLAVLDIRMFF